MNHSVKMAMKKHHSQQMSTSWFQAVSQILLILWRLKLLTTRLALKFALLSQWYKEQFIYGMLNATMATRTTTQQVLVATNS
jgi:hypothetical protein